MRGSFHTSSGSAVTLPHSNWTELYSLMTFLIVFFRSIVTRLPFTRLAELVLCQVLEDQHGLFRDKGCHLSFINIHISPMFMIGSFECPQLNKRGLIMHSKSLCENESCLYCFPLLLPSICLFLYQFFFCSLCCCKNFVHIHVHAPYITTYTSCLTLLLCQHYVKSGSVWLRATACHVLHGPFMSYM